MNPYEELKELKRKAEENCGGNRRSLVETFYKNAFDSIEAQLKNMSVRKDSFNTDLRKLPIPFGLNRESVIAFFVSKGFPRKSFSISGTEDAKYLTIKF